MDELLFEPPDLILQFLDIVEIRPKVFIALRTDQRHIAERAQGGGASVRRYLGGIRYDINPFNAFKLEVRRERRENGDTHALVINTAFAF